MVLESDNTTYIRNTMGIIYSRFEVPIGASYACGKNNHNIFRPIQADTDADGAIWFSGIQVYLQSFCVWLHVPCYCILWHIHHC